MTLVLFTGLQISVSAEENADNKCGDNITWTLENGVLTISGTGDMYNYSNNSFPWYNSRETITSAVIEDGVTSIGDYAFWGCSNLPSIEIPSTVKYIGIQTFYGCNKLTSITIPESVTYINGNAFNSCSMLETIFYPNTCELHENAFRYSNVKTLIKYTVTDGKVTISAITDKSENDISGTVEIPATIGGKPVVAVAESYQGNVGNHTHTGGTATCEKKAECDVCGTEYGKYAAHNYENGECTVCHTPDPNTGDDDNNNDNIDLKTDGSTLTISGTGALASGDLAEVADKDSITDVVIEDGITSVGDGAFDGFTSLETVFYPQDTAVSENAFPENVTQVEYSETEDGVVITDIKPGDVVSEDGKVVIPDSIGGKDVVAVDEDVRDLVSPDEGHDHSYGEDGKCTICGADDESGEPVVSEPTVSEPTVSEPTVTEPTGSSPTGTSPTAPSTPPRPSAPSNPSSPSVTTAAAETTTVTVTTAEEIIADDNYTGEDVSAGAADNSDDGGITDMSMVVIVIAMAAVIACAVLIKKLIF